MNYRPIISFREIRNHERELMKNAEAILKELGFKFKASSPFQDDREWELEFSDDDAKEIYIQFVDDADEDHSPIVIIDNILTDSLQTVDGESAYYEDGDEIDETFGDFENFKNRYLNEIKDSLDSDSVETLLYNIFSDGSIDFKKKLFLKEIIELKTKKEKIEKSKEIIDLLLNYISDEEIMNIVYSIID